MLVGRTFTRVKVKVDGMAISPQSGCDLLDVVTPEQYNRAVAHGFRVRGQVELRRMDPDTSRP